MRLGGRTGKCLLVAFGCTVGLALGTPVSALASGPTVTTLQPISTSATTATARGLVEEPKGEVEYYVEYSLTTSAWCHGSGSPEVTTPHNSFYAGAGQLFKVVEVNLTGLKAKSTYCLELVAEDSAGSNAGAERTLTAGAPSAFTYEVIPSDTRSAIVDGGVDPAGQTSAYYVAYGLIGSEWCKSSFTQGTPQTTPALSLATVQPVEVELSGLEAGAEYCAEVIATNPSGASDVEPLEWMTFISGAPTVIPYEARSTGPGSAIVEAEIDPADQPTEYTAEYGLATSEWCVSEGFGGSPSSTLPFRTLGSVDSSFHLVVIELAGLRPGSEYCEEVVARNGSATESGASNGLFGDQLPFKTAALYTLNVTLAGTGSGTVTGSGISCPGSCAQSYASGTVVTLTAKPAAGSTFTGWSTCPGTGTCASALTADRTVVATFTANPPPAPVGVVSVVGSTITVKSSGGTAVKLTCTGNTTCVGKLTLTAKITTKKGRKKHARVETIGTASFSIAPGATATVSVKLNGSGRTELSAAHGHLSATLAVVKTSPGPSSTASKTIRLTLQKAKKGRG